LALTPSEARRLVDAQALARDRVHESTLRRVLALMSGFDQWWSDGDVEALARRLVLVVEAGQAATARATDAYLARVISDALGRAIPPVGVPITPEQWRKADHVAAFMRPAADVRRRVAQGTPLEVAAGMAAQRAQSMAATDLALAMTNTSREVFRERGRYVDGYRRIIHPEASRGGTCGLCAAASDRTYSSGDLLPIHDNCRCEVLPIVNGQDPGRDLSTDELDRLYSAAGSTKGADLKRVLVEFHEHGELGPVLREQGHNFRGPADVAAA
jgi:hypothetical protein